MLADALAAPWRTWSESLVLADPAIAGLPGERNNCNDCIYLYVADNNAHQKGGVYQDFGKYLPILKGWWDVKKISFII
ncbi:MAG TPA: hypothetical protein VK966_00935, partial [Longimicrobiales bacterium]|nr:hypothetical protein [Longimicrobiales bacterium]